MSLDSDSDCEKEDEFDIANPAQINTGLVDNAQKDKSPIENDKIINSTQNNISPNNPCGVIESTISANTGAGSNNNANNMKNDKDANAIKNIE